MKGIFRISGAVAAVALYGGLAFAQAMGGNGGVPGTVDSTKATAGTREERESFNRAAGDLQGTTTKVKGNKAVAASAADLVEGAAINDRKGVQLGTIQSLESDGVIVTTGTAQIKVPLDAFGKNKKGLLLGMTKAEFDAAVAQATGNP